MEYLAQYYKNLSEHLQQQINALETQLNEIRAYTDAERQDPNIRAREEHQAARLVRMAQAHNRSLAGTPSSEERTLRSQRLSGMLGARGLDVIRLASTASEVDGRIDSASTVKTTDDLSAHTDVTTGKTSYSLPIPMYNPIETQTEFDMEGVPETPETATRRGGGNHSTREDRAKYANELMAKRRAKIRQQMDEKGVQQDLVRKARTSILRVPPATGSSASH